MTLIKNVPFKARLVKHTGLGRIIPSLYPPFIHNSFKKGVARKMAVTREHVLLVVLMTVFVAAVFSQPIEDQHKVKSNF